MKNDGIGKNHSTYIEENFIETVKYTLNSVLDMAAHCVSDYTYTIEVISISIFITQFILASLYISLAILLMKSISKVFIQFSKIFHSEYQLKKFSLVNYCNNINLNEEKPPEDSLEYPPDISHSANTRHIKSFLLLIIAILIFFCTYFGVAFMYSYDLAEKIHYTPILKINLVERKSIYKEIQYYSTKSYILKNNISQLLFQVNYTDNKKDYVCTIRDYVDKQKNLLKVAQKSKFQVFTSSYNTQTQLYTYTDPDHFFSLGSSPAGRSIVYDMLFLAKLNHSRPDGLAKPEVGLSLLSQINARNNKLTSILDKLIDDLDDYSMLVISSMYIELIIISILFSVIVLITIFIVGQKFLAGKEQSLLNLRLICTIMINN